ncbi:MAG: hypothetical protein GX061_04705 [Eubacteriaceae bacterium]|nr:hypothetical protein [Eubacteriaceae bacterium]
MIHILRENESASQAAAVYGLKEENLRTYNTLGDYFPGGENEAVWMDCGGLVRFDEISGEAKRLKYYEHPEHELNFLHSVSSVTDGFVPIDNWGRDAKEIFIDGYGVSGNNLLLPADYPAINACVLHRITPSFVINSPGDYLSDEIGFQLVNDLSFKEYRNVLIRVTGEAQMQDALKLSDFLRSENFGIFAAMPYNCAKLTSPGDYERVYYETEKTAFDFESFTLRCDELQTLFGEQRFGVLYTPRGAQMDPDGGNIRYLTLRGLGEVLGKKEGAVMYDESCELAFFRIRPSRGEGEKSNVIYEDLRSFYAKAAFCLERGIKYFCINGCGAYFAGLGRIFGLIEGGL